MAFPCCFLPPSPPLTPSSDTPPVMAAGGRFWQTVSLVAAIILLYSLHSTQRSVDWAEQPKVTATSLLCDRPSPLGEPVPRCQPSLTIHQLLQNFGI